MNNFKILFFTFLYFLFTTNTSSQTTIIPDTNFEQFLIDEGIDTNGLNGNILNVDAQSVTILNITGSLTIDFTGLEAFTNVIDLNLNENKFTTLPLTSLTALEKLSFENNILLNTLDLTQNINLIELKMSASLAGGFTPPLITLDLSQNTALEDLLLYNFRNLSDLILPNSPNQIRKMRITHLGDATLDFTNLNALEDVYVLGSSVAVTITLPTEQNFLKKIYFSSIDLGVVDVSNYLNLERLDLFSTNPEDLILPNTNTFTRLTIWGHNFINPINLVNIPDVIYVDIRSNQTVPLVIDVTNNLLIETLWLTNNDLNSIDLTLNTLLNTLYIYDNNLTSLDVTLNTVIETINASRNQLPSIDLTQNLDLKYLTLTDNLLPNLDLTQNLDLSSLLINQNLFTTTGLDLTQNPELTYLNASNNQIESLNILQNTELSYVIINHNLFTGTDILDQYFTIWQAATYQLIGGNLIVHDNMLSGIIPEYTSIMNIDTSIPNLMTRRFKFEFFNNKFEFGHFENQHSTYLNYETIYSPAPHNAQVVSDYRYASQVKVNNIENFTPNAGNPITLTTIVSGAQNHYTWFKDGVAIVGAPDSPNYTIPNLDSCDTGTYHCEITSDLVPFENADPPGTNNRNLLLIRNDINLTVNSPTELCVSLSSPLNGEIDVYLNPTITWLESLGACGYYLTIGTTTGGNDILNNVDVVDVNFYTLTTNLPSNTQIFVTITPYFENGTILTCSEESFTTGTTIVPASCTNLSSPLNGSNAIAINSDLVWNAATNATGYFLTIGTTTNGTDILNNVDVGNVTTYNPVTDFPTNTQIYVTITPYNTLGNPTSCLEESFTTTDVVPVCTALTSPLNGSTDITINSNLTWNAITNATGYNLTIGTSPNGNDILNNLDVGNVTTYNPVTDFPTNTQIYVSIIPYNASGNAIVCSEESFTTTNAVPVCTTLTSPLNGSTSIALDSNLTWNTIATATGYFLTIGTTAGGNDILNNLDVGNVTTYNPVTDFPANTQIYVSITPYNTSGNATACSEESFTTTDIVPLCTTLTSPLNGSTNIALDSNLTWNTIANATGYFLTIGTTAGGNDILNNLDVGNVTTYNPVTDFPANTQIYVSITPYNTSGNATACSEESFTTTDIVPLCTTLTSPLNGSTNIALDSNLTWNAITNATGYFLTIGTTAGGNDILNNVDIGNITTYNPVTDFPANTQIYVSITPYNTIGNATACSEESFTTTDIVPLCTTLTSPLNGSTSIALDSNLTWNAITNATGYFLTIGTTAGGNDILSNVDVGNVTTYNPVTDFPANTQIYVSITPYNTSGNAITCSEESFTTINNIPLCTNLTTPLNGSNLIPIDTNLTWNTITNATGYILTIGTNAGGNDILNNVDVGNMTTYNPVTDFPEYTQIFVNITPYNALGSAITCLEESFTTTGSVPDATILTSPFHTESGVLVSTTITWDSVNTALGYFISIGTTPGGSEIVDSYDAGNNTSYIPTQDLPINTVIYICIIPYNAVGQTANCTYQYFITENIIPTCTSLISPFNGEIDVALDTNISWNYVTNTSGYIISIGITPNGNEIVNEQLLGDVTSYTPLENLPTNTIIYVKITPTNEIGDALDCTEEFFTTELITDIDIPKFFTPNGDGKYDNWKLDNHDNIITSVLIFDRYGKILFDKKSQSEYVWNGLYNKKPLDETDYWYKITFIDGTNQLGHLSLIYGKN